MNASRLSLHAAASANDSGLFLFPLELRKNVFEQVSRSDRNLPGRIESGSFHGRFLIIAGHDWGGKVGVQASACFAAEIRTEQAEA